MELPFTVTVGAFSMLLIGVPREIQVGPMSLSGALTLLVAILTLLLLPVYAINSPTRKMVPEGAEPAIPRAPWPLWLFVLFVSVGFLSTAMGSGTNTATIQNACIYLSFLGAIVFATATKSLPLVLRGWDLMRSVSTWFAYVALAASALELGPVASDRPGPARAMAIVGLVALAAVIPGTPRNNWMRFAPFAMVVAIALTLSRTGTAIGLASLVFLVLRGKRATRGRLGGRFLKSAFLLAGVAASAYWLVIYYAPFRDRFLGGDNAWKVGDVAISTQGRSKLWELVLSNSHDSWLLGHGVGSASQLVTEFFPGLDHPHNEYLRFYFDFGIVGATLFFAGYAALIWRAWRSARKTDHPLHWAAFIALISVALAAITDNPFVYPYVMLPLGSLAGLSLALTRFEIFDRCEASPSTRSEPNINRPIKLPPRERRQAHDSNQQP